MAQYALPEGAVRRRTVFGLLDADGWTWATLKAVFWFMLIIFLLGYLPDRAYYFTVSPTVDLGYNAISPINLCPPENKTLPCPAPAGAVIPWEPNPEQLALPAGRSRAGVFTSGTNLYLIGGFDGTAATTSVLATTITEGSLSPWAEGPALPEARSDFAVMLLTGVPYVVGGAGPDGVPTDTVFRGVVEAGELTGWEQEADLALPVPLSDLVGIATGSGLYVFGGRTADGISAATYRSELTTTGTPTLQKWAEVTELPLPEARANGSAVSSGGNVYVLGGEGPGGPSNMVYYLALDTHGDPALNPDTNRPFGWGVSTAQSASAALPEPRYEHASFVNSGAIYVLGGRDAAGAATKTNGWAVPNATDGTIASWHRLDATDLPAPVAGATAAAIGQFVFLIGGTDGTNQLTTVYRADLAPQPAFFRLGLFGLTIPALSIKGEIGQQLGYLVAGGVAMGAFVGLLAVGWMYSHRRESRRFFEWLSRGRYRAPQEDEYQL